MAGKIRVRHALPLWQRLRRCWRGWRGAGLAKTHVVHFVDIGEARFKRVLFADSETARAVAEGLEHLADSECFPGLLMHQERQLWVGYLPGRSPALNDPADQERLIDFFVRLYASIPPTVADPAPFSARLVRNLDFLSRTTVLTHARADQLRDLERRLRPDRVQVGYDYIDPLGKNFVVHGDRVVAIDIEALVPEMPLGTGLAKAKLRWPFDPSAQVLSRLAAAGGPELAGQLVWTELCFLCDYFKQKLLQGKPGYIRLEALDRLLPARTAKTPP
jgi:hypothetical protein